MNLEIIKKCLTERPFERYKPDSPDLLAAVGLVLKTAELNPSEVEILLIRRAEREGDPWSGQMGLPGGRFDAQDADQYQTVLRETREEVGLDLEASGDFLGRLDDIPATARAKRTGLIIAPYVFALRQQPQLSLNHEVAETLWAPLGPMVRGEIDAITEYQVGEDTYVLPAYTVQGRIVWGLTYAILQNLFSKVSNTCMNCTSAAG
jgi:8-oxo-dGTP pyrophosphatase MutT (NUDIX family)